MGKGWFNDVLDELFEKDSNSRLTSSQIATVFNHYYNNLGRPDLLTNAREVGGQLRASSEVEYSVVCGMSRYQIALKPGSVELPPELLDELAKSRLKYRGKRVRNTA